MSENDKFYLDAGTTWSKILHIKPYGNRAYSIVPSSKLPEDILYTKSCGHRALCVNTLEHVNEVVALSYGAKNHLKEDGIVLDIGSRDAKWVRYKDSKFSDMDWNCSCGSATGATVEMLLKFYDVKIEDLKLQEEKYPVTCGIFAFEKIMDDISKGITPEIAIAKFIHGLAFNAFNFTKNPENLLVSGGFCDNKCFIDALNLYCSATALGRYVLVDGLSFQM